MEQNKNVPLKGKKKEPAKNKEKIPFPKHRTKREERTAYPDVQLLFNLSEVEKKAYSHKVKYMHRIEEIHDGIEGSRGEFNCPYGKTDERWAAFQKLDNSNEFNIPDAYTLQKTRTKYGNDLEKLVNQHNDRNLPTQYNERQNEYAKEFLQALHKSGLKVVPTDAGDEVQSEERYSRILALLFHSHRLKLDRTSDTDVKDWNGRGKKDSNETEKSDGQVRSRVYLSLKHMWMDDTLYRDT